MSTHEETRNEKPETANTHDELLTDHEGNLIFAAPVNAPPFVIVVKGVRSEKWPH